MYMNHTPVRSGEAHVSLTNTRTSDLFEGRQVVTIFVLLSLSVRNHGKPSRMRMLDGRSAVDASTGLSRLREPPEHRRGDAHTHAIHVPSDGTSLIQSAAMQREGCDMYKVPTNKALCSTTRTTPHTHCAIHNAPRAIRTLSLIHI